VAVLSSGADGEQILAKGMRGQSRGTGNGNFEILRSFDFAQDRLFCSGQVLVAGLRAGIMSFLLDFIDF